MNDIIIGHLPDGSPKSIDLESVHTLLIAGGTLESRERVLDGICKQTAKENLKILSYVGREDEKVEISEEDYKTVSGWCAELNSGKPTIYIIDDYAEFLFSDGVVPKSVKSQFKKDVLSLAQAVKSRNACLILVCCRPCADTLTSQLKHHFMHRISLRTKNRVDSYAILDMPAAASINDGQLIYSDGLAFEIINCEPEFNH